MCVCVCVCVCARRREHRRHIYMYVWVYKMLVNSEKKAPNSATSVHFCAKDTQKSFWEFESEFEFGP